MMLVEADARGERQVRTHAHEHRAPPLVIHVEVVLHYPPLRNLQMPTVVFLVPNRDHDASRFPAFNDGDDRIRLSFPKIRLDEFVTPAFRRFQDGHVPFLRTVDHPILELTGDVAQHIPADRILLPVKVEKPDHSFRLLKGLDQAIQQEPIEAAIAEPNAILVMFEKGVHGTSSVVRYLEITPVNASLLYAQPKTSRAELPGSGGLAKSASVRTGRLSID